MFLNMCTAINALDRFQYLALHSHLTSETTLDQFREKFLGCPAQPQQNGTTPHQPISTKALRVTAPKGGNGACYDYAQGNCSRSTCRYSHAKQEHKEQKSSDDPSPGNCKF